VYADVCPQVDEFSREPYGTKSGFNNGVRGATERQYRPVVVRIHRVVE
jgi:hypothetical protein